MELRKSWSASRLASLGEITSMVALRSISHCPR
jgi:hypothetical protein